MALNRMVVIPTNILTRFWIIYQKSLLAGPVGERPEDLALVLSLPLEISLLS